MCYTENVSREMSKKNRRENMAPEILQKVWITLKKISVLS